MFHCRFGRRTTNVPTTTITPRYDISYARHAGRNADSVAFHFKSATNSTQVSDTTYNNNNNNRICTGTNPCIITACSRRRDYNCWVSLFCHLLVFHSLSAPPNRIVIRDLTFGFSFNDYLILVLKKR